MLIWSRQRKIKRDQSQGLTFGWRGSASSSSSTLGAILITTCVFAFAAYALRVTLSETPRKQPTTPHLLIIPDALDQGLSLQELQQRSQSTLIHELGQRVETFTHISTSNKLALAPLPKKVDDKQVKLPSLIRPGSISLPPINFPEIPTRAPITRRPSLPVLRAIGQGRAKSRWSEHIQDMPLPKGSSTAPLGGKVEVMVHIGKDGSPLSAWVLKAEPESLSPLAEAWLSTLHFTKGDRVWAEITLEVVEP